MKHIILTLLIFVGVSGYCQQEATTTDGKKVVLNEDGTWKYDDTAIEKPQDQSSLSDSTGCSDVFTITEDKVTGNVMESTELLIVSKDNGKTGFGLMLAVMNESTIYFYINAVGGNACIDEEAKINILFTDGTRTEFNSNNKFNCESEASMFLGAAYANRSYALLLAEKKVDIMRVRTGDKFVEQQFTDEQAETFRSYFRCATLKTKTTRTKR